VKVFNGAETKYRTSFADAVTNQLHGYVPEKHFMCDGDSEGSGDNPTVDASVLESP
jgi:hypothetical protein